MKKKQLDISDFSIYWDSNCTLWGDLLHGELQVPCVQFTQLSGPSVHAHQQDLKKNP